MPPVTREPSLIDPRCLYSHYGFISASGLSRERLRTARRDGINCRRIWVGKRAFYRGADIITFIERLAAADTFGRLSRR